MRIEFEIPDEKVQHFTDDAKTRLIEQTKKYSIDVIYEAERIEDFFRENGASHEITDNIIFQAVRRNKTTKKKRVRDVLIRIAAELLLFIAGIMFIPEKFVTEAGSTNIWYLIAFIVVTLTAFISTIITYFVGGE